MEPQYNKPLYNKVLSITNDILCPSNSKDVKENFGIMKLTIFIGIGTQPRISAHLE